MSHDALVQGRIVALCGGIGGAKLALGLAAVVPPDRLTIIVNTGDDFRHFGLCISPDIDTVIYTLAGRVNPETGWGRADETWRFMAAVAELDGESWFNLGDTDLATHAVRTARLMDGARLTDVVAHLARAQGVEATILPVSDDPIRTILDTDEGPLPFQRYFVARRCEPVVRGIRYEGAETARLTPEVAAALDHPDLAAVVVCPSNMYLSIDPMLSVGDLRTRVRAAGAPVIAVSPIVGGTSLKGPLGRMMADFGCRVEQQTVADHYQGLLDALVIDDVDAGQPVDGPRVHVARTVMESLEDRVGLAREVLGLAAEARAWATR